MASIVLTKGFSLLTIPLMTNFVSPADYGHLDVVVSFMEFLGLIFALGLADTLFRFASNQKNASKQSQIAAEIIGTGIILAVLLGITVQLFVPVFLASLPIEFGEGAIRAGFFAATLSGLIALPLAWVRLKNQPFLFFIFTAMRGFLLALSTVSVAWAGYDIETILYTNAAVDILIATIILSSMIRSTGVSFRLAAFKRTFNYGLPLVGGSLAMFALGALDRWFLVGTVSNISLAHYAVATKLALAAPLLMQPFSLWWFAQRYEILAQPQGRERVASIISVGFVILFLSAAIISLAAPLFIHITMPAEYMKAVVYLPWLVAITVLNESNGLLNLGVYRKDHGYLVMTINSVAAIVALVGYWIAIPTYGIAGAIAATLLAQSVRLCLFLLLGQKEIAIPYALGRISAIGLLTALIISTAPPATDKIALILWTTVGLCAIAASAFLTRLIHFDISILKNTKQQTQEAAKDILWNPLDDNISLRGKIS
ncbi:MAG: lipopolysaccharide biosynthesis protein [Hyphomicrobiales bacterium]